MAPYFYKDIKVGILGGGQLGRMLIQSGLDLNVSFAVLDPDPQSPCRALADFTEGSLVDYETVLRFGDACDVLTIEIENVNAAALAELERRGKRVFPQPSIINLIQDKRKQKQFFIDQHIPTAPFCCVENQAEALAHSALLPAVNKLAWAGYDGRGVQILRTPADLQRAFDAPGVLEKEVDIQTELAVIVARDQQGVIVAYDPVEMRFDAEHNILDYLVAPARISSAVAQRAVELAEQVTQALDLVGILAVEMFLTPVGELLVNELAPRPHNSGHHTIESCVTSQYLQHLRVILGQPLGSVKARSLAAVVNLLGSPGHTGSPVYRGIEAALARPGVYPHLYGKKTTKPFRKMGHITILEDDFKRMEEQIAFIKAACSVVT